MDERDRAETRAFRAALLFCLCRLARVIYNCANHSFSSDRRAADSGCVLMEEARERYLGIASEGKEG